MWKTYPAKYQCIPYVRGHRIAARGRSYSPSQGDDQSPQSRTRTFHPAVIVPVAAQPGIGCWPRSFNLPETAGGKRPAFLVFQQVAGGRDRAAKSLCRYACCVRFAPGLRKTLTHHDQRKNCQDPTVLFRAAP